MILSKKAKLYISSMRSYLPMLIGIALVVGILIWIFSNKTVFQTPPQSIRQSIDQITTKIKGEEQPEYFIVRDDGCSKSDVGFLTRYYECTMSAQVYIKERGSSLPYIQRLQHTLKEFGLKLDSSQLTDRTTFSLKYQWNDRANVYVQVFYPDGRAVSVSEYLNISNHPIELEGEEFLYGVKIVAPYWSCTEGSLWQAGCPEPPTPVRN